MNDHRTDVTHLLGRIREGDGGAHDKLLDMVYQELRGLAGGLYARHSHRNTLQPTALVHEAWIKLAGHLDSMEGRRHFFAIAAKAMRQILADRVRDAKRLKRGGDHETVVLHENEDVVAGSSGAGIDLIDLDDKLSKLTDLNARYDQIVEMRLLGSMTMQEIAEELDLSKRTVDGDWAFAKAWLKTELMGY